MQEQNKIFYSLCKKCFAQGQNYMNVFGEASSFQLILLLFVLLSYELYSWEHSVRCKWYIAQS